MLKIAVIVLAAGCSSRMKTPKQLLEFDGKTFLQHAMDTVKKLSLDKRIIVTGAYRDLVEAGIDSRSFSVLHNPNFMEGMSASLRVGINYLQGEKIDAVLVMLCDQPLIPIGHYEKLLKAAHETDAQIITSEYGGTIGVPSIFKASTFAELLALESQQGAKSVIHKYKDKLVRVFCKEAEYDIDTPEDYKLLMKKVKYNEQ